jgi:hypothetical protein
MSYAQADRYYYEGRTSIRLNAEGTVTIWNHNCTPEIFTKELPPNGVIYVNSESGASSNMFDQKSGNVFISGTLDGRLTVAAANDIYVTGYDPTVYNFSSSPVTNGIFYKDTKFNLDTTTGDVTFPNDVEEDEESC